MDMEELIGKTLSGRYKIVRLIGRGGMASVYLAHQESLGIDVALKVLQGPYVDDPSFFARFRQEAKTLFQLHHEHIVSVHDFNREGDLVYLVMEYVDGGSLSQRLAPGRPLLLEDAIRITTQVGSALVHAHGCGIVHRDIKPSNILFRRDGRAVLSDFGIVKVINESAQQLTRGMMAIGTAAYMSPEQGLGRPVDARSDIYSLGIVLYEMLTGRVPFEAETPSGTIYQHIHQAPEPPRKLNPAIPPAVEQVILRAIAKEPDRRYQTVHQFMQALQEACQPIDHPVRQPKILAWALGGILLVVAAIFGIYETFLRSKVTPTPVRPLVAEVPGPTPTAIHSSTCTPIPPTSTLAPKSISSEATPLVTMTGMPIIITDTPTAISSTTSISFTPTSLPTTSATIPPTATPRPATDTPRPPTPTSTDTSTLTRTITSTTTRTLTQTPTLTQTNTLTQTSTRVPTLTATPRGLLRRIILEGELDALKRDGQFVWPAVKVECFGLAGESLGLVDLTQVQGHYTLPRGTVQVKLWIGPELKGQTWWLYWTVAPGSAEQDPIRLKIEKVKPPSR